MADLDDFKLKVGERLKEFIAVKHFSKKDFAAHIGCSSEALYGVLKGKNGISTELLFALLSAYPNLNLNWLFKGLGQQQQEGVAEDDPLYFGAQEKIKSLEAQVKLQNEMIDLLKKQQ